MRRSMVAGLLAIGLAAQGASGEPAEGGASVEPDPLAELDRIFDQAIAEGLLIPSARSPSGTGLPQSEAVVPSQDGCALPGLPDFSGYRNLSGYKDILVLKSSASATGSDADAADIAMGYIAIGLYQEAAAEGVGGAQGEFIGAVAALLGDRTPNTPYFEAIARCHDEGQLWLSLSYLADDQARGAALLQETLGQFRALPSQIQIDAAVLAVPSLIDQREDTLISKLIAGFEREQIASSSALRFALALADVERGTPEAGERFQEFLVHPRFKDQALAALLDSAEPLSAAQKEVLLDEVTKTLERVSTTRGLEAELAFLVDAHVQDSDYRRLIELSHLPGLQNASAQATIEDQLVRALRRDLGSQEPIRRLAALEAASNLRNEHPGPHDDQSLFDQAGLVATQYGLLSLVPGPGAGAEPNAALAESRARIARRRGDCEAVQEASERLDTRILSEFIMICWIHEGNVLAVEDRLEGVELDLDMAIALATADVLSRRWMLPDRVYAVLAEAAGADGGHPQAQQLIDLRRLHLAGKPEKPLLSDVAIRLAETRNAIEQLQRGPG